MKLATLKDGSRDGQLIVVSRDLAQAHAAGHIAGTLQRVLDDWNFLSPQLEDLYATLNGGKARHAFAFDLRQCMAPLPRAHQWVQFAAYPTHAERLLHAASHELPATATATATATASAGLDLARRASDDFLGPGDAAPFARDDEGLDLQPGLAVITADLPAGADAAQALDAVRLLLLVGAWTLHEHPAAEPAAACAPLAVTPDELGAAWQGGRAALALDFSVNGRRIGRADTAAGMAASFGELLARLASGRRLRAGGIVGAGPVSAADGAAVCLAELRALETLAHGAPRSAWLRFGDHVQVQALAADGHSVFGAIEQTVTAPDGAASPAPSA